MIHVEHECSLGVVGRAIKWNVIDSRNQLGSWGIEGDTPVDEINENREHVPEYHGTLETLWESGETILQG